MNLFRLMSVGVAVALLGGCVSTPPEQNVEAFKRAEEYPVSTYQYRIDPPDQIIVRAPNIRELDPNPRTVAPDGTVTYNLIGTIFVQGMTPDELATKLTELTKKYYVEADIKVEIIGNSKFYKVFGPGFTAPTEYPYTGRNDLVSAMAIAGIQYDTGYPQGVVVNRPAKGNRPGARAVIDFTKMYEEGDLSRNYLLEEGDILYMQHDGLTKISIGMGKILNPLTGASGIMTTAGNTVRPQQTFNNGTR
mgnify:CR=1 FL=1